VRRSSLVIVLIAALVALPVFAQDKAKSEYAERSAKAGSVLTEIMGIPEQGIPEDLMSRARAVAVIPHVVKGALGIGGQYGKGLVSQRTANGKWSAPAFIEIGGGSFGLQLGVEASDLVLVFTNDEGVKSLLKGKVKLGADASVAAGPVGRKANASTDVLLKSAIWSYSRSKGLFAGVSLDGSVIAMDDTANKDTYGKPVTGEDILAKGAVTTNATGKPFVDALEKFSPKAKSN